MFHRVILGLVVFVTLHVAFAPPVDQAKNDENDSKNKTEELDDYGLEYGRYLQQVVQALEEDKDFAKKLENITSEQIRNGNIAKELQFVKHNVRSKLDELKRIEVDRLRKLIQEQMERIELGLYRDENGHLNSPDGRRWRTIPGGVASEGLHRNKGVKIPEHVNIENPLTFEIEDLKKLIQTATSDLEEIDKKRREEFKKYELEKEATYRESLRNMTDDQRKEAVKHHEELAEKHKEHPKVHHPGSKDQLQQVWEDQDHLPKDEFNPKTFFAMHDVNGDGHLDVEEVEAILIPEIRKMYNPDNSEDDPAEMEEEFHRMREHIFNETDLNKDAMISLEEFLKMTEKQEFQKDEGWQGLDEQQIFSEGELEEYMRQKQMHYTQGQYLNDPRMYYDIGNSPQHGMPPHINYQVPPGGIPQPGYPQGYSNDQQYQQQFHQGQPQQQFHQGQPQQQFHQGQPQQQFHQGQPQQQFHQGQPQQQFHQGQPQQQFHQGQPQQQFHQGQPQQQFHQGQPQQQFHQGQPQQQFHQGQPQQQFQQGQPQQQFQQGQPQQQFQQGQPQQGQSQHQSGRTGNQGGNVIKVAPPPQQAFVPSSDNAGSEAKVNEVHAAENKPQSPPQLQAPSKPQV